MKKLLLATTAAAALTLGASAARAEINLDLGGFFKGYAGYASNDRSNVREFDIKRKSQVFFTGETTLDNGLTVGYHGELSQDNADPYSNTTGNTGMEESYLYMSGNWGRLNLGRENGAAYLLQVAAPSADANIDGQDIAFNFADIRSSTTLGLAGQANGGIGVNLDYQHSGPTLDAQYSDKITYITPKLNGFQAGFSYTPELKSYTRSTQQAPNTDNGIGEFENLMEAALRYDGKLGGVGIHVGGGYSQADAEVSLAQEDYQEWNTGLKLTYEGFAIGAAYNTDNGVNQTGTKKDRDAWTVGADYTYGVYNFGLSYFKSDAELAAGEDKLDRYTVGASYTYGPGMSFRGAVAYFDYDASAAGLSNEATVVTLGTDVQF